VHPRESWQAHPDFHGLVSFWLERHMMFRQLMAHMGRETEAFLDGNRDAQGFAQGMARYGGLFVNQLHGHHQIEDHHYFPLLRQKDAFGSSGGSTCWMPITMRSTGS
jgi:hemerythrin-like domain-containing protein